jgi:hypothetical protein
MLKTTAMCSGITCLAWHRIKEYFRTVGICANNTKAHTMRRLRSAQTGRIAIVTRTLISVVRSYRVCACGGSRFTQLPGSAQGHATPTASVALQWQNRPVQALR